MKTSILIFIIILLTGCKTVEYVDRGHIKYVDRVVKDSVYVNKTKYDSIYVVKNGDTLVIEKFHTQYTDRFRHKTDTLLINDTLYLSKKQVVKSVDKTGWYWFAILSLLIIIYIIFKIKKK